MAQHEAQPTALTDLQLFGDTYAAPEHLRMMFMPDDGMEPAIRFREFMLVDCSFTTLRDHQGITWPGIFVFDWGGHEVVRRVDISVHGVMLKQDNPVFGSKRVVPPAEISSLGVVGRVIAVLKKV